MNSNSILILLVLIAWGATAEEANQELATIIMQNPSIESIPMSEKMLEYEEMYIEEEIILTKIKK